MPVYAMHTEEQDTVHGHEQTGWVTPDFEVIDTALEVTAYAHAVR